MIKQYVSEVLALLTCEMRPTAVHGVTATPAWAISKVGVCVCVCALGIVPQTLTYYLHLR